MSTFIIIILILALVARIMSRTSPTIVKTEKNKHLFSETKITSLNENELKNLIINKANDKQNAYINSKKIVTLCKKYFHNYGWDITVLEIIITALSTDKKFDESHNYANVLIDEKISYKWGYFFKGELKWYSGNIIEGNEFFEKSIKNGMNRDMIDSRKKELLFEIKPNSRDDELILSVEKSKYIKRYYPK